MTELEKRDHFWYILEKFARIFQVIWHNILLIVIGSKKGVLPPIRDGLLLESGVSLAEKIRNKQVSSVEVVTTFIRRIECVDPLLNAVVEDRFEEALKEAKAADEYIRTSGKTAQQLAQEKPFLGVPFTSKNAIGVKDLVMDAGVARKKGVLAREDSTVVGLMRKAGGIPLCVTNVPEYCNWFDASNTLYGRTNNPYDLTRICGGSSGGEGALVGASASPIGIGNDIFGSVRMPCYYSGIFGHKPTRKVISNKGQYPSSYQTELDEYNCTGPMCKSADDLLPAMKVMTDNHPALKLDQHVNVKDIQIYYTDKFPSGSNIAPLDSELEESVNKVVAYLEGVTGKKAKKVRPTDLASGFMTMKFTKYVFSNAAGMIEEVTGENAASLNLVWEYLRWITRSSTHTLNALVYMTYIKHYLSQPQSTVAEFKDKADSLDKEFEGILGNNGVFIYPNLPEQPYYHEEQFLKLNNCSYTVPFNILGYPVTQCPTGLSSQGLPLGVQVVGLRHNDRTTIAIGKEIGKGFGGWKSPSKIF